MVSLIQSNYSSVGFGSGLAVGGAGFALQNRGGGFTLEKGHANELAGRKRPLHTIIPAFMERGDVRIAFGIMGGWNQAQAHAQFVSNVVDFGMNIQARARRAALLEGDVPGLRRELRVAHSGVDARRAHRHGPPDRDARRLLGDAHGRGSGGDAELHDGREHRRVGSAQGWRRRAGASRDESSEDVAALGRLGILHATYGRTADTAWQFCLRLALRTPSRPRSTH